MEAGSIDEMTERKLPECVDQRFSYKEEGEQSYVVDAVVKEGATRMRITEAEDSIWTLRREYCKALKTVGFRDLRADKPHIPVESFFWQRRPYGCSQVEKE